MLQFRFDSVEQKKNNSYEHSETGYRLSIFAAVMKIFVPLDETNYFSI